MQVMKWSVIALAVAAGSTQMAVASSQSESKGFLEDSTFNIFNRILYHNRDFRNGGTNTNSVTGKTHGYREETGLGIRLLAESGFTQGIVGVGVDAHSLSSIKLDSGKGRYGSGQFAQTDDGSGDDTQTEVGGAIKFRLSAMSSQTATGRDSLTQSGETLKSANIVGASYSFTDNFSGAIHASDVEDFWKKKYVNLNLNLPLAEEQALNFDFNYYKSDDEGQALAGELDNKIWSLAAAYSLGAHKFTLAHQRSTGDTGYNYGIDGGGTIWLSNSVQYSDFLGKDERSWQARYDIDMATFGVPGLSFMTRYITGDNIDVGTGTDAKEHELDMEAKYVIQEGAAKDLSFRVRNAIYRANSSYDGDNNDFRLIVEYQLSVL